MTIKIHQLGRPLDMWLVYSYGERPDENQKYLVHMADTREEALKYTDWAEAEQRGDWWVTPQKPDRNPCFERNEEYFKIVKE